MFSIDSVLKCENCGHELDRRPFDGVCSMLGPQAVICPRCQGATATDRVEWAEMTILGKAWYVIASLSYVMALAIYGASSFWCVLYFWFDAFGKKLPDGPAVTLPGAILWGGAGATIQGLRIRRSLARTRAGEGPAPLSRWDLDLGLQLKVAMALFAVPLVAWALAYPARWFLGR